MFSTARWCCGAALPTIAPSCYSPLKINSSGTLSSLLQLHLFTLTPLFSLYAPVSTSFCMSILFLHLFIRPSLYCADTACVSPAEVNSCMRVPEAGRSTPVAQLKNNSAMYSSGVQVLKSALGMNFLFIGVSKVTGRIATAAAPDGIPLFLAARL